MHMKKEKEKKPKENKKMKSAMTAYFDVQNRIGLTDDMTVQEKLKKMLSAGVHEMSEMNEKLDAIISEDWDYANSMLGVEISKAQYKEFVTIMTKIRLDKFSDKNREKYEADTRQKRFDQFAREQFLDSVINQYDENFSIPENRTAETEIEAVDDEEFNEILNKSIERNIEASSVHKKLIDNLGLAFEYITNMKYTKRDFKTMLDWKYYSGGIPNETSHSRLFDIFYKFMSAARLGADFELSDFDDFFTEMGMKLELVEPMPRSEHWSWWTPDMIEKYCPTIKEEYFEWLKETKKSEN